MTAATHTLDTELIEALEHLIRDNVESSRSFQEAARARDGSPMAALLREIALARFEYAADLRRYVRPTREQAREAAGRPESEQSWWRSLASSGHDRNARALLAAADRAEAAIEVEYERIIARIEDHPAGEVVRAQEHEVRRQHGRILDLRMRSTAAVFA